MKRKKKIVNQINQFLFLTTENNHLEALHGKNDDARNKNQSSRNEERNVHQLVWVLIGTENRTAEQIG